MKMRIITKPGLMGIHYPKDTLSKIIAKSMLSPSEFRDELTSLCQTKGDGPIEKVEKAFLSAIDVSLIEKKVKEAIRRDKSIAKSQPMPLILETLLKEGVLTEDEVEKMKETEARVQAALGVDEF